MEVDAQSGRVLVVSDDHGVRESLNHLLKREGHRPLMVDTAAAAVRVVAEGSADITIVDTMLAATDPYKLIGQLKADAVSFFPIIAATALGDGEAKRRAIAAGADDFITIPVVPIEVRIRLATLRRIRELVAKLDSVTGSVEELVRNDELTDLHNRRAFQDFLEREFARSRRYRRPISVLFIDIDGMKGILDNHGIPAGDEVLVAVAEAIRSAIRIPDIAARYGGDEIAILAPETDAEDALALAERLRAAVEQTTAEHIPATVSVGVATHPGITAVTATQLVLVADEAMQKAKGRGRNCCVAA